IADFKLKFSKNHAPTSGALFGLREKLFNPGATQNKESQDSADQPQENIRLFTCTDRETEIRKIAKEIKRLVVKENYPLGEIALVVRERASYVGTIARVMRVEKIFCNLKPLTNVIEIQAVRAARRLIEMLDELAATEQ